MSWTNWEWVHSFEIFGTTGYLQIDGLDTRYRGPERLSIGHADPRSGAFPNVEVITFTGETKESSFRLEAEMCMEAIQGKTVSVPTGADAIAALQVVEKIYAQK